MSWFHLDASTIACRVRSEGDTLNVPSLGGSIMRGLLGCAGVSVAGFIPWTVFGSWLIGPLGEGGTFGVSAAVFALLSGLLLHRLIIGPGSLLIFYKLFGVSFAAFAVAWIIGWTCLGDDLGNVVGLLAGSIVMGWMLTRAFEMAGVVWKVISALFLTGVAGYFVGGWVESAVHASGPSPSGEAVMAQLLWAACFGAGFGAGLGVAFHLCQADVRELLRAEAASRAAAAEA